MIGITARRIQDAQRWVEAVDVEYGEAVVQAGGLPILLGQQACANGRDVVNAIDALLLTGGGDVDPCFYHQKASAKVGGIDRQRDEWELELTGLAVDASLPILGICRGCQVLNVARGGSLVQDLPDITPVNHLVLEPRHQIGHRLSVRPGSRLAAIVGPEDLEVNTIHHQAVDELGSGLRVGARSGDGVIESIELEDRPVLGVQWHPEDLVGDPRQRRLFTWLVNGGSGGPAGRAVESDETPAVDDAPPAHA